LFGLASPQVAMQNVYWIGRVTPAYFDGDPMARTPEGVHYLRRNENLDSLPRSLPDWLGVLTGVIVLLGIMYYGVRAWRMQNHSELLLAAYPIVNMLLVIVASVSHGSYYSTRRYIFASGLFFSLWWGICIVRAFRLRIWPLSVVLSITLFLSLVHQFDMLHLPDELRDYRAVASELEKRGIHYGLSWFSIAHVMTALTNERTIFATIDYGGYKKYQDEVLKQDEVALVYPTNAVNPPQRIQIAQRPFARDDGPVVCGELSIAVYRRVGQ
jgi:hypothetical protein